MIQKYADTQSSKQISYQNQSNWKKYVIAHKSRKIIYHLFDVFTSAIHLLLLTGNITIEQLSTQCIVHTVYR